MDEILANIRKIIAEDPVPSIIPEAAIIDDSMDEPFEMRDSTPMEADAAEPKPATVSQNATTEASKSTAAPEPDATPAATSPLKSRLSDALTSLGAGRLASAPAAAASPAAAAPSAEAAASTQPDAQPEAAAAEPAGPQAIDDDLADLLDEPMPRVAQRAPAPVTPAPSAPAATAPAPTAPAAMAPLPEASAPVERPQASASAPQPAAPRSSIIPATAKALASMAATGQASARPSPAPEQAAASPQQEAGPGHPATPVDHADEPAPGDAITPAFERGFDPPQSVRPARQRPWDFGVAPSRDDHPLAGAAEPRAPEPDQAASPTFESSPSLQPSPRMASPGQISFSSAPGSAVREPEPHPAPASARIDFDQIVPGRERDGGSHESPLREPGFMSHAERTLKPTPSLSHEPSLPEPDASEHRAQAPVEPETAASPAALGAGAAATGLAGLGALASLSTRGPAEAPVEASGEAAGSDAAYEPEEAAKAPEPAAASASVAVAPAEATDEDAVTPAEVAAAPETTHPGVKSLNEALERVTGLSAKDGEAASEGASSGQPVDERTLDETAAELLRPLVREWLDKNMPRIFERALRIEMAESVKRQLSASAPGAKAEPSPATQPSSDKTSKH